MSSSKFSRRPRIQPLPPVCKKSPETTSCYNRPDEPPEPFHAAGALEIVGLSGLSLYYSTFHLFGTRSEDYRWTLNSTDSEDNPTEVDLEWERELSRGHLHITFAIPVWGGQTFDWPNLPLTPTFPWYFHLQQTQHPSEIHICHVTFWN